ncbi:PVC-type heme-binding CxxCH protein [Haloferula chungangensis]|uniref:PVC-type heme-binding CxxCH protein n=1 Tax=Haloferula chungangensis TaxID=1048331 RepID=A0ABW2L5Q3_9BACT
MIKRPIFPLLAVLLSTSLVDAESLQLKGAPDKPGNGKHIVLLAGDEEYRSEEACPMLAKILSTHHGFDTTVLFSQDADGNIDPNSSSNIPGTKAIDSADLVITGLRFRDLPDAQLQPLADYLNAGKPIFGFRTSTHAFKTKSKLGGIDWNNFGPEILGEGWAGHYGKHAVEGARGVPNAGYLGHPILHGVQDVFVESDVYGVKRVTEENATILMHGVVTANLLPDSYQVTGKEPQPSLWIRQYQTPQGGKGKAVCSTMGASSDLDNEGLRRLFVNTAFYLTGVEVPVKADVTIVDPFEPSRFQFMREKGYFKKLGLKPADFGYGKSPTTGNPISTLVKVPRETGKVDEGDGDEPKFADIPGPKIISTITPTKLQQEKGRRPKYYQPKKLDGGAAEPVELPLTPEKGETVVLLGNSLAERMNHFDHFEGAVHASFPGRDITFRNMGFPGHTPGFRPEAGNDNPWAFPGANKFRPDIHKHFGNGHYPHPDEWLTILSADTIIAFFGFNESFAGMEGLGNFRNELAGFVDHTLKQGYNYKKAPKLVLATPTATEDLTQYSLPDASARNEVLAAYAKVVREVAEEKNVGFVELFEPSSKWTNFTINGVHLNEEGYAKLSPILMEAVFGKKEVPRPSEALKQAIKDKNWFWKNDYRVINGVHVYGGRWAPYGNFNYPEEIEKVRQMTVLRDQEIWAAAQGKDIKPDDALTRPLSKVETNYAPSSKNGVLDYLEEAEAMKKFTLPDGYEVSTFATEAMFPNLANPMQMRFDNKGRLWVSTMPSYPQYRPGDPKPNDKILIYEDTDGDGRADKETVWADGLSIPIGFSFAPEGVYLTDGAHLVLLQDTDGDDRADQKDFLLDGFDPHDSHHSFSAFDVDNGGGIFMLEGRFLHSQVETPYGPQRMTDGGAWRFDPHSWKVERVVQTDVSNPWGMAHDEYGQNILNDASGGVQLWVGGYSVKMPHGAEIPRVEKFNYEHHARPTSGSEFIYSSHFPDDVQGDYIYGNTIGFLGIKQFQVEEDGPEIKGRHRQDLISSSDGNFRPADLEFAFDGSLYFLDWHNALIGHMQHSGRDPNRSSEYGRIYRITYPSRPFARIPEIHGASIDVLFENMKLPELQARKRSHLELRGRKSEEVIPAALKFAKDNAADERLVLEALWATWGQNQTSTELLDACFKAKDHRVRSAAARVVRHSLHLLDEPEKYLLLAAADEHPRVRIEALSAASWLGGAKGAEVLLTVAAQPREKWINNSLNSAMLLLKPEVEKLLNNGGFDRNTIPSLDLLLAGELKGAEVEENFMTRSKRRRARSDKSFAKTYELGRTIFNKEGSCVTCHQESGDGLKEIYPPISSGEWVTGDKDRLIKLVLHGIWGKIEVNGKVYDPEKGVPPMTAVGAMFNDKEVAAVLTYVRSSWGNDASDVSEEEVKAIRSATKDRKMFYTPEELLKEHPFPKK